VSRFSLAIGLLAVSGLVALGVYPKPDFWVTGDPHFTTAELAIEESWIKGAAPILAASFNKVSITNLNKDVPESFVFDIALSEIYEINTNYDAPPLDLRAQNLEPALTKYQKERSEIFCNNPGQKYCELLIAWTENSDGSFTAVRITNDLYGIISNDLIPELTK
jgi:hypothetical protein